MTLKKMGLLGTFLAIPFFALDGARTKADKIIENLVARGEINFEKFSCSFCTSSRHKKIIFEGYRALYNHMCERHVTTHEDDVSEDNELICRTQFICNVCNKKMKTIDVFKHQCFLLWYNFKKCSLDKCKSFVNDPCHLYDCHKDYIRKNLFECPKHCSFKAAPTELPLINNHLAMCK